MAQRPMTPFLRNVLRIDAVLSGLTALVMLADAEPLAEWTGLPAGTLRSLGAMLIPWTGLLAWLAGRATVPAAAIAAVIVLNIDWAIGCALAAFGIVGSPQGIGTAVLAVQALGTLVMADLEWLGLRRAGKTAVIGAGALAG